MLLGLMEGKAAGRIRRLRLREGARVRQSSTSANFDSGRNSCLIPHVCALSETIAERIGFRAPFCFPHHETYPAGTTSTAPSWRHPHPAHLRYLRPADSRFAFHCKTACPDTCPDG